MFHFANKRKVAALFDRIVSKKQKAKRVLKEIYGKLRGLLDNQSFFPQLRNELMNEYGDLNEFLAKGVEEISDDLCPIVVAGITYK